MLLVQIYVCISRIFDVVENNTGTETKKVPSKILEEVPQMAYNSRISLDHVQIRSIL